MPPYSHMDKLNPWLSSHFNNPRSLTVLTSCLPLLFDCPSSLTASTPWLSSLLHFPHSFTVLGPLFPLLPNFTHFLTVLSLWLFLLLDTPHFCLLYSLLDCPHSLTAIAPLLPSLFDCSLSCLSSLLTDLTLDWPQSCMSSLLYCPHSCLSSLLDSPHSLPTLTPSHHSPNCLHNLSAALTAYRAVHRLWCLGSFYGQISG